MSIVLDDIKKYVDVELLLKFAKKCKFNVCTYSASGTMKIDKNVRSGQVSQTKWSHLGLCLDEIFRGSSPHPRTPLLSPCLENFSQEGYFRLEQEQILLYSTGNHFASHVDTQIDFKHIGTLCCIICSDDIEGGVLVLESDQTIQHIPRGIVFIPLGMNHHVTPVTKGTRYVFKGSVICEPYVKPMILVTKEEREEIKYDASAVIADGAFHCKRKKEKTETDQQEDSDGEEIYNNF